MVSSTLLLTSETTYCVDVSNGGRKFDTGHGRRTLPSALYAGMLLKREHVWQNAYV